MKRVCIAVALIALFAGQTAMAQLVCAGAQGASQACAQRCSGTVVNDSAYANNGKFDVGGGNQGDGNDGFQNVGNFNIGSGYVGNCILTAGTTTGSCDPSNNNGQIALRFCSVYPNDQKCQPSGYLAEYTSALKTQIAAVVASCNNGTPLPPPPPTSSPPPPTAAPPATPPTATPPTATPPTVPTPPAPTTPGSLAPGSGINLPLVSDSKADLITLLTLLAEHIDQDKATGRKMLLK